jgi:threonine synthase
MSGLACRGCGKTLPAAAPAPYTCPNAGHDDGDHVMGRTLDASSVRFSTTGEANPFLRYRALTHAYSLASSRGVSDEAFTDTVRDLDVAVAKVAGFGFVATPFGESRALSDALELASPGGVWIKDETHNVSGSHKARHLMGLAILGETLRRVGLVTPDVAGRTRLAIASCGNAALAAAIVARAWNKPLDVFIPTDANPRVVRELERLDASVHVCERSAGTPGDPCYLAFREAVQAGALPFCCQGSDNGLCIEGGETLVWEMIGELLARGRTLDRLFVQVGGGALASACIEAFRDAIGLGVSISMPRIHAVQTRGAFPLRRAWERVVARIAPRIGLDPTQPDAVVASGIQARVRAPEVLDELDYAAKHRAEFMWPWETAPSSIAHGILDDETYDWLAIVRGMVESGGFPLVVSEEDLVRANTLGRSSTGIDVDETGSSGLAGLLALQRIGGIPSTETVGIIFSGVRR